MDKTIGNFVDALRNAEVEVSPAETLDAVAALEITGVDDRTLLRNTLSLILAKTPEEKALFNVCFDRFFSFRQFEDSPGILEELRAEQADIEATATIGPGEENGAGGEKKKRRKSRSTSAPQTSRLGHILLSGDANELSVALTKAAKEVHLDRIKSNYERGLFAHRILFHLGVKQLDDEIDRLSKEDNERSVRTAQLLIRGKQYLVEQVRDYVDEQFFLIVDGSGKRFLVDAVTSSKLTNMQVYYFDHIREAVRKLAHQLAKRHAKKKKVINRGQLDIRKTLRKNVAYDGALFDLRWKQIKVENPKIFVICDVSGSVKNVARFLLTFLYSLNEVLPRVRSFAFSNELGEVSEFFEHYSLEEAIEMSLDDYGKGSTDYGQAFRTFKDLCFRDIDSKSTVIILGDGRNNYFATGADTLKEISEKCHQVIWLNPEPREQWHEGDAEMQAYLPACHFAEVCNSLPDLERMVSRVLRSAG
ncbi:MAG TPA: VWA domain-containing protein [Pseudomonadales bacterium]|nr:VWA domain-containing protein [Pseudomonadales bacterium]MDP6314807.1 VWA domain-containing protein [Pseudomonadales bacterium]MDP7313791.1 VWA domain-containing protein [Pseudomonadales bacterium]HJL61202.1 VWA domain-containing protein [Pseudomonadales bacterium]HJP51814.1 VWA domain-containing protein [Pseudomonadales bacterium]